MTVEEEHNQEIWWALKKIRKEELRQKTGEPFEVILQSRPILGLPPIGVRVKAIQKVGELGGIKITNEKATNDTYGRDFIYTVEVLQPKFNKLYKKYEAICEPKKGSNNLPTDPQVIKEYIWVVNTIERERQRTPEGEVISYPVPETEFVGAGVPSIEQENLILKRIEQTGIIEITEKMVGDNSDIYRRSIRAVVIPDLERFLNYRENLLSRKEAQNKEIEEEKYRHYSTESIKKIICVLDKIKDKSDLVGKEVKIPTGQIIECCDDFYELEGLLKKLEGDGLIIEHEVLHDFV